MKQRTIVAAGVIALTGLTGLTYAAQAPEKRAQEKPQGAASGASARILHSREGRETFIKAAVTAVHKSVQIDARERNGDLIPGRFWGEALQKLRPLRVVNDRMNIMIVLTEDSRNEKGLYVSNPISSYFVANTDPRFASFEPLSKREDRTLGQLFRYHIKKQQTPINPGQDGGRASKEQ